MSHAAAVVAPRDLVVVSLVAFRTRRLRAAFAVVGVTLGIAAMVAVLGISASSKAGLIAELDRLGTNLLQVQPGQGYSGDQVQLPSSASAMLARVDGVVAVSQVEQLPVNVYRSEEIPAYDSNGISVYTADFDLLATLNTRMQRGAFLNAATARYPVAVLGAVAAERLGLASIHHAVAILVGGRRFVVAGVVRSQPLTPDLDSGVFIGRAAAARFFRATGHASAIFLRTDPNRVVQTAALLGATANPEKPDEVVVLRPSDAIAARAAAKSAFTTLFLGLGAVALLVGGIGIANVMVIGVLERRSEIGLRRSLGATRGQIRLQFLTESLLIGGLGGCIGVAVAAAATALYAHERHWRTVVPTQAIGIGLAAALAVGALAGLYPAMRAARLSPAEALRTA